VSLWRVLTPKDPDINWVVVEPYPSEKYDFVSWDDEIANMMGKKIQMLQTTSQSTYGDRL